MYFRFNVKEYGEFFRQLRAVDKNARLFDSKIFHCD
jgi:hypothetical protein